MPATDSSTTADRSPSFSCCSRPTGASRREKRVAITLSKGNAPSASNASTGLESTITMITPIRMKRLDKLIGPSDSHWLIW